jgi:hypothetical protein
LSRTMNLSILWRFFYVCLLDSMLDFRREEHFVHWDLCSIIFLLCSSRITHTQGSECHMRYFLLFSSQLISISPHQTGRFT